MLNDLCEYFPWKFSFSIIHCIATNINFMYLCIYIRIYLLSSPILWGYILFSSMKIQTRYTLAILDIYNENFFSIQIVNISYLSRWGLGSKWLMIEHPVQPVVSIGHTRITGTTSTQILFFIFKFHMNHRWSYHSIMPKNTVHNIGHIFHWQYRHTIKIRFSSIFFFVILKKFSFRFRNGKMPSMNDFTTNEIVMEHQTDLRC